MDQMAQEIQETWNNTKLLMDQRHFAPLPSQNPLVRCFFCKRMDAHPHGTSNCPEAQAMVSEGLCKFHNVHIFMLDDLDPPRHSVEVMVYQYDKLFGYGCWMTSVPTISHIFIFCCILLGYCNISIGCHGNHMGNSEYPKN